MRKKDGGQAFPISGMVSATGEVWRPVEGMTLRDYFAAAALQGFAAFLGPDNLRGGERIAAGIAYEVTDAMLAEREKR